MNEVLPRLANFSMNGCHIRLGLDKRHIDRASDQKVPIAIIYQVGNNWKHYVPLNYRVSVEQYYKICHSTAKGRPSSESASNNEIKTDIINAFNLAVSRFKKIFSEVAPITKEHVLDFVNCGEKEALSFTDFWKLYADNQKAPNTAASYNQALRNFLKHVGEIKGFAVSVYQVKAWDEAMKKELSDASRGIYLRSLRAVWNAAQRQGLIAKDNYPFSSASGHISPPTGGSRKRNYLRIEKMTMLYRVFIEGFPDSIPERVNKEGLRKNLGLFLLQYLCNGANLADLANLRYSSEFFKPQGERVLLFRRQKTRGRNELDSEVCVPVILPLAYIIDQIAAPAVIGELVVPQICKDAHDELAKSKRVAQVNKEVREHMHILVQSLGWTELPGGAWARHAYATNLRHAGVPEDYIRESMGHSFSGAPITERYIDRYPIAKRIEYNSLLLQTQPDKHVESLTDEELEIIRTYREKKGSPRPAAPVAAQDSSAAGDPAARGTM